MRSPRCGARSRLPQACIKRVNGRVRHDWRIDPPRWNRGEQYRRPRAWTFVESIWLTPAGSVYFRDPDGAAAGDVHPITHARLHDDHRRRIDFGEVGGVALRLRPALAILQSESGASVVARERAHDPALNHFRRDFLVFDRLFDRGGGGAFVAYRNVAANELVQLGAFRRVEFAQPGRLISLWRHRLLQPRKRRAVRFGG